MRAFILISRVYEILKCRSIVKPKNMAACSILFSKPASRDVFVSDCMWRVDVDARFVEKQVQIFNLLFKKFSHRFYFYIFKKIKSLKSYKISYSGRIKSTNFYY